MYTINQTLCLSAGCHIVYDMLTQMPAHLSATCRHMSTHMCAQMSAHMSTRMSLHARARVAHTHARARACVYTSTHIYTHVCTNIHTQTCLHTHVAHTCLNTHMRTRRRLHTCLRKCVGRDPPNSSSSAGGTLPEQGAAAPGRHDKSETKNANLGPLWGWLSSRPDRSCVSAMMPKPSNRWG